MHFHKYPYHPNFEFVARIAPDGSFTTARGPGRFALSGDGSGAHRVWVRAADWTRNDSRSGLPRWPARTKTRGQRIRLDRDGGFQWRDAAGELLLASAPGRFFGRCGEASIFEFLREEGDRFYGFGEKWTGLEHSGRRTKFWNTDVWADFHPQGYAEGQPPPDPVYLSLPYMILQRRGRYLGLLLDNPHATFISTGARISIGNQMDLGPLGAACFHLGADRGQPNLYLIEGPSLAELTRRMQRLVGTTPRPPLWALGYHQCRWGYRSAADLEWLDERLRHHRIPADGLWLDIDYMDGYRVFTFSRRHFRDPAATFAALARKGRHVVPVLDPGVKHEPGFPVYERGRRARAFCLNPQGREFVGLVWPGDSVFPDFSRADASAWWAREVRDFARLGITGAWIDMNDPSTGPVDNQEMLFDHGRRNHSSYHNQYAVGMAAATREGLRAAHPQERPFLLSRSGFIGCQRHTAIWTGDNSSNYHHLKAGIATTLNLALSGVPFNAPDVGGFGGDVTAPLLRDWFKACFLFPFLRNHTCAGTRAQEPWAFDRTTLSVTRHYIRLRYKLLPYLYQLFVEHERTGEAILRPLFYDFTETRGSRATGGRSEAPPLSLIDDQFLVGPALLQAPIVVAEPRTRRVLLPGNCAWWDASTGRWHRGGRTISATGEGWATPLFVREGSLLPMQIGERTDQHNDLANLELHCFRRRGRAGRATLEYTCDDGRSFAYRDGGEIRLSAVAEVHGGRLTLQLAQQGSWHQPLTVRLVVYDAFGDVQIVNGTERHGARLRPFRWRFTGDRLSAWATAVITIQPAPTRARSRRRGARVAA